MSNQPLAERLRPKTLEDYIGQEHLVGKNAVLRKMIESGNLSSLILWGPPGSRKNHTGEDYCQYTGTAVSHAQRHKFRRKRYSRSN